jgi:hypothetical protein
MALCRLFASSLCPGKRIIRYAFRAPVRERHDRQSAKAKAAPVHTNTDSPLPQNVDNYDVTMQVGNAVYTCRYKAPGGQDISWLKDKARDVRVKRESILLKRLSGEDEVCPIVRKEQTQR